MSKRKKFQGPLIRRYLGKMPFSALQDLIGSPRAIEKTGFSLS
jgi:hypothetical protein